MPAVSPTLRPRLNREHRLAPHRIRNQKNHHAAAAAAAEFAIFIYTLELESDTHGGAS
jgi:hypothetical protein